MARQVRKFCERECGLSEAARKIFRMAEFCRRHPDRTYVPDPYYEGHEGFELVLDMLEDGCEGILEYLSENGK